MSGTKYRVDYLQNGKRVIGHYTSCRLAAVKTAKALTLSKRTETFIERIQDDTREH